MCLTLYVGCREPLPLISTPDLRIEPVEPGCEAVKQWFSQPSVQFVGAHTGCSCGFPYVVAETPIEYWEGMWPDGDDSDNRQANIRSMRALVELLQQIMRRGDSTELYPVWNGNEACAPKGQVAWSIDQIAPETALFTEQFMYTVQGV